MSLTTDIFKELVIILKSTKAPCNPYACVGVLTPGPVVSLSVIKCGPTAVNVSMICSLVIMGVSPSCR